MLKNYKLQISWSSFYEQWKADISLWFYFILFQQMCRLCFICTLNHYLAPQTKLLTILYAMIYGLRFDSLWATCWLFIALLCFTLPSLFIAPPKTKTLASSNKLAIRPLQKYRRYLGFIFTLVTTLLYIMSIEYFREYKDIFNQFLFCWFYDDKMAILKTIYAEHYVIRYGISMGVIMWLYTKCSRYFIYNPQSTSATNPPSRQYSIASKTVLSIAIILFYIISFRGGIGPRPIQLKDAGITTDEFLNKAIISPYSTLKYATKEHLTINRAYRNNADLSAHELQTVAKKFFNKEQQYSSLAKYMEKAAQGSRFPQPKHIFVIVGESLDAWPLQNNYRKFNLTPNLHKIIANSIYFKHFLACAYGTIATLNTIMTGIPDMEMHINYQKSSYSPYPTTLATQFKKLGFKPQFFYGGYLSWQRLGDFAHAQDFAAVYGAAHINNWRQTNEWGVDDRTLFEFIATTIHAAKTPTFNIIMTTSNHPPFSINLEQEGFHKEKVAELLAQYPANDTNVKELGHIWYADKTIAEFIEKMLSIDNTALFAITGDHFGRRHVLTNPPSFDTSAVPLIIYSAKIKEYCTQHSCKTTNFTAGSHLDLGATLIELVAPKGFTYFAMGDNLLTPRKFNVGLGQDKIITPDFIASAHTADITYFKKPGSSIKHQDSTILNQLDGLKERFKQATSIAQYLIKKGDMLYETD